MLPQHYKFHIQNRTGATIEFSTDGANNSFTILGRGWKWASGAVSYGTEFTAFADPTADLAAGTSLEAASAVDNSTDLFVGAHFIATITTDAAAAATGMIDIYVEYSTDGGTTYPSDAADFIATEDLIHVASINCASTSEDRSVNFEL